MSDAFVDPSTLARAAEDPEWAEMVREYASQLPSRVEALAAALATARTEGTVTALAEPRTLAHRLYGTSGSYGFDAISVAAERVENELIAAVESERALDASAWRKLDLELDGLRAGALAAVP